MARFVIPMTIEVEVEAEGVAEALVTAHAWRDGLLESMTGGLCRDGACRFSIAPVREVMEVDSAWLENRRRRPAERSDWRYESRTVPLLPGSSLTVSHRIALGPKPTS